MSATPYGLLLTPFTSRIAEENEPYIAITKRHLMAAWFEQKYFNRLFTREGKALTILSPGAWNGEAGPEFIGAELLFDDKKVFGDIAIDLTDDGWHRRRIDGGHENVVLHLSYWQEEEAVSNSAHCGYCYLENALTISPRQFIASVDLDLYPYQEHPGSGRCAEALFHKLSLEEAGLFFRQAADWRLSSKRHHLHARCSDPRRLLAAAAARAMGYRDNAETFLDLYMVLTPLKESPFEELLALALGACGLFNDDNPAHWACSSYYTALKHQWEASKSSFDFRASLSLQRSRPLNNPARRLACLVKITQDAAILKFYQRAAIQWEASWPLLKNKRDYKVLFNDFCDLFPDYTDSYWNSHYTFETKPKSGFLPMIGETTKRVIIINGLLPLLHEAVYGAGHDREIAAFQNFYNAIPNQPTGKGLYLAQRLFGDTNKKELIKSEEMQQGLYQLHHDFCLHHDAGCRGCPFVERFESGFQRERTMLSLSS